MWIYVAHAALYLFVGLGIGLLADCGWAASWQFGLSLLVWGVVVRTVAVWHITWSVNSLTHLFGYSNYDTDDHSRNNWLVALLAVGEGWHNNHHAFPTSARHGLEWWQFDSSWMVIRTMERLRLVRNVRVPTAKRKAAKRRNMTPQVPASSDGSVRDAA